MLKLGLTTLTTLNHNTQILITIEVCVGGACQMSLHSPWYNFVYINVFQICCLIFYFIGMEIDLQN